MLLSLFLISLTVKSSNEEVVKASATDQAVAQSLSIRVDRLATNETWIFRHSGVNDPVTKKGGTFQLSIRGERLSIPVPAGTTLKELAMLINEASDEKISAVTYETGDDSATSARLSITDNHLGKAHFSNWEGRYFNIQFGNDKNGSLESLNAVNEFYFVSKQREPLSPLTPLVEGLDALIYLNGNALQPIYWDSNQINSLIPGVSIQLLQPNSAEFVTLTVHDDSKAQGE